MAIRLRPESRNPIAAPGRIACAIASPARLIRRNIMNTPIGAPPSASANSAGERAAHEFELDEGRDQRVIYKVHHAARGMIGVAGAGGGAVVERLAHPPRLAQIVVGQRSLRSAPRPPARRASSRVSGTPIMS